MNRHRLILASTTLLCSGCGWAQLLLSTDGREAERTAAVFSWMTAFAGVVVTALALFTAKQRGIADRSPKRKWIIAGGAATHAGVLAVLLIYGLGMLPELFAVPSKDALRIHVTAEQWWWRFRYEMPGRMPFETANELWLPVGEPVEFLLHSTNVIHSFWIPSLGGKVDVVPGRINRLVLHPTITGTFFGTCAEYCGAGHAKMALQAVVVPADAFGPWVDSMQGAAQP